MTTKPIYRGLTRMSADQDIAGIGKAKAFTAKDAEDAKDRKEKLTTDEHG